MPLVDLWDVIESKWGDGVPHELEKLELPLVEGFVTLEYQFSEDKISEQAVRIQFSDSKDFATVMGKTSEVVWKTAKDPFFILSDSYRRFYVSRDRETMRDYVTARRLFAEQVEYLAKKIEKDKQSARATIVRARKVLASLEAARDCHYEGWEGGFLTDRALNLNEEKIIAEERRIREANDLLGMKAPPNPDRSYYHAVRFCGIETLDLSKITDAVSVKKRELIGKLGILPTKPTAIPITNVITAVVSWDA